jgi:hypothetical protein
VLTYEPIQNSLYNIEKNGMRAVKQLAE